MERRFERARSGDLPSAQDTWGDDLAATRLLEEWSKAGRRQPPFAGTEPNGADREKVYEVESLDDANLRPDEQAHAMKDLLGQRAASGWRAVSTTRNSDGVLLLVFERDPLSGRRAAEAGPPPTGSRRPMSASPVKQPWPSPELLEASEPASVAPVEPSSSGHPQHGTRTTTRWAATAAAVAVLAILTILAVALRGADEQRATPAPSAPPAAASSPAPPPCAKVPEAAVQAANVTCSSRSATLTLGVPGRPLVLPGLEVRVLETSRAPGALFIRMRVRNTTGERQEVGAPASRLYLTADGRRLTASPTDPPSPVALAAGQARTVTLRVPVTGFRQRSRGRDVIRADLGIVPFRASQGRPRIGVISLSFPA